MVLATDGGIDQVLSACRAGVGEAAEAIARAVGMQATLAVGEPIAAGDPAGCKVLAGPGLVCALVSGGGASLVLLPQSSGLVPDWAPYPDPTGTSRLTTLAQELGMVLLPESQMPDEFKAAYVADLEAALVRAGMLPNGTLIPIEVGGSGLRGAIAVAYQVGDAWAACADSGTVETPPPAELEAEAALESVRPSSAPSSTNRRPLPEGVEDLPPYSRSLLKIRVPITVTLARKRQRLSRILELGPGSIIQFDKSCEEMLDLDVGGRTVASGEAVKVGDKFGLRVCSIVLPQERFRTIKP